MQVLTELQQDALSEIFNIGMGRAAHALSRMANDDVRLAVPTIAFATRKMAAKIIAESAGERICSVRQRVEGEFNADAILIFPEANSLEIVRLMVGDVALDSLSEMEMEALSEVGNIILNSCIGTLTNILGGDFVISLPNAQISSCSSVLELEKRSHDESVMLIFINFFLENRQILGHVAILQDIASMPNFMRKVEQFLKAAAL